MTKAHKASGSGAVKALPEGTLARHGKDVTIAYDNLTDAIRAFDILEASLEQPSPAAVMDDLASTYPGDPDGSIRAALSATEQPAAVGEPVAWRYRYPNYERGTWPEWTLTLDGTLAREIAATDGEYQPLYATPASAEAELRAEVERLRQTLAVRDHESDFLKRRGDKAIARAEALKASLDTALEAVLAVVSATQSYLPPDGISAQECLNLILAATDNPKINPIIAQMEHGNGHA